MHTLHFGNLVITTGCQEKLWVFHRLKFSKSGLKQPDLVEGRDMIFEVPFKSKRFYDSKNLMKESQH